MQIVDAVSAEQVAQIRELFEEYWASFGFTPCFQGFGEELAGLPGAYSPPGGGLWLALMEGIPAGCIALRRIDEFHGEFKRLYVRPHFRGDGLGRRLLATVVQSARQCGYRELVCDTMPVMTDALAMYQRSGFAIGAPYSAKPTPGAIYLRMALES